MELAELNITTLVAVYGPMIIILLWFMFRLERVLNRLIREINLNSRATLRLLERKDRHAATDLSKELYDDH